MPRKLPRPNFVPCYPAASYLPSSSHVHPPWRRATDLHSTTFISADWRWNGILKPKHGRAFCVFFTDDLENSLSVAEGAERNWRLGDRRESADADSAIANYVLAHWTANQESDSTSDSAFHWTFVGKEIDFDLTYIYLESPAFRAPLPLSIGSDGFFELFDDQVNEITLKLNGSSRREWLSTESSSVRIESIAP